MTHNPHTIYHTLRRLSTGGELDIFINKTTTTSGFNAKLLAGDCIPEHDDMSRTIPDKKQSEYLL